MTTDSATAMTADADDDIVEVDAVDDPPVDRMVRSKKGTRK